MNDQSAARASHLPGDEERFRIAQQLREQGLRTVLSARAPRMPQQRALAVGVDEHSRDRVGHGIEARRLHVPQRANMEIPARPPGSKARGRQEVEARRDLAKILREQRSLELLPREGLRIHHRARPPD